MPELLRQVTMAGSRAGVEFALFEPKEVVTKEFHVEHPIAVRVRGNYHQVGAFIGRLSNMDRIVNVSDMVLGQPKELKVGKKKTSTSKKKTEDAAKNTAGRSNNTVEATFTLTAYTLLGGVTNEAVNDQHASNN
jgi:Tfp pilus assembly protein PilO